MWWSAYALLSVLQRRRVGWVQCWRWVVLSVFFRWSFGRCVSLVHLLLSWITVRRCTLFYTIRDYRSIVSCAKQPARFISLRVYKYVLIYITTICTATMQNNHGLSCIPYLCPQRMESTLTPSWSSISLPSVKAAQNSLFLLDVQGIGKLIGSSPGAQLTICTSVFSVTFVCVINFICILWYTFIHTCMLSPVISWDTKWY